MAAAASSAHPPFRFTSSRSGVLASEGDGNPGKEVDRDTLFKMVRSAANAKLAGADGLRDETKEMRRIADIAEAVGDHETASALRATLKGLVDAAKS